MTSLNSTDATGSANPGGDGAGDHTENGPDSSEQSGRSSRDHFSAVTGAYADPVLIAVLEGLRATRSDAPSSVWSVLNDSERLRAVRETGLLEQGPHPAIDQIVGMTVEAIGIPHAALNMITDIEQVTAGIASSSNDVGDRRTYPLTDSLCVYVVAGGAPLIIDDIVDHPVLGDHSAARSGVVGSYIGIPIVDGAGHAVGTLCAWDTQPHHWSSGEIQIMTDLAHVVQNTLFDQ